ncbi:hypothetical protein V1460_10135 [Streptomyces sp. SCSIO 30461]|uniref:hypothetical protein n=1 Tax=Streptomyces sp. SCSIO 30461 TaxID=3118085 RepID=UPI0030CECA84
MDLLKEGLLHGQARHAPHQVVVTHVWGHCPRCKHRIDVLQTHHPASVREHGPPSGPSAGGEQHAPRRKETFVLAVACACPAGLHPGAPEAGGCGVSFRIEVPFMNQDGS